MGPAILITLGVLFLLDTLGTIRFHYTWPVILIVIGAVQVAAHSASAEGHIQPAWFLGRQPIAPQPPQQPGSYAPPQSGYAPPQSGYTPPQGGQGGSNV